MSNSERSKADSLSGTQVALYLFIMPLLFTASLHYLESQNKSLELRTSENYKADFSRLKYVLADSKEVKKHLMFYSPDTEYKRASKTLETFNYSLPLLGQREMKIIKGKEDNLFRSANHQQYVVNSS